ncbi:MAG: hypothetical protein HYR76_12000 [Ignavibacteria bacterium]|nr:hypothetical protein [Ignavibacteria bacterium]MBI3765405.1 hypothetical protein [Ignavibacteriales bacterium]
MKAIRVLLIDTTTTHKQLLEQRLLNPDSIRFNVRFAAPKHAGDVFKDSANQLDLILIGEKISPSTIVQTTKMVRSRNLTIPIFALTKQSEARVPRNYQRAGVDDMINIADIDSPLFSWTFVSTVEHVVLKKKAREYDVLHRQLRSVNDSLAYIMHEINNPLSVIRLALYHLDNPELPGHKRDTFLKLLVDNLERVESQMNELRLIRRDLGGEPTTRTKILTIKPAAGVQAKR